MAKATGKSNNAFTAGMKVTGSKGSMKGGSPLATSKGTKTTASGKGLKGVAAKGKSGKY